MTEKAKKADSIIPAPEIDDAAPTTTGIADAQPAPTVDFSLDPFSPQNLLLPQAFDEQLQVQKLLTLVPVRKPHDQEWIRVHPDPAFRQNLPVIFLKNDREFYVVEKNMAPYVFGETVTVTLYTAITRQGIPFLWPVRLPGVDGKDLSWWRSARDAADRAVHEWIRIRANLGSGGYDVWRVPAGAMALSEPVWPEETFWALVKIAFKNNLIDSPDHTALAQLRGLK